MKLPPLRMPFGKFKGRFVDSIPIDYLTWLAANVDLREPLRSQVYERLSSRPDERVPMTQGTQPDLKSLRRRFASKYHPDRPGGSRDAMRAVNDVFDTLDEAMS